MLCTRCHQREARVWPAEKRAGFEAKFGTPWPFPDDLCKQCQMEWFTSPEGRERLEPFHRAMRERCHQDLRRMEEKARATALKVLDFADRIAGKI